MAKKKKKSQPKIKRYEYMDARFVCPKEVNSTVRVVFEGTSGGKHGNSFNGDVYFGDCTRTINWTTYGVSGIDKMLQRLDNTLEVLTSARDSLLEMKGYLDTKNKNDN